MSEPGAGWAVLMGTLDHEGITSEKLGVVSRMIDDLDPLIEAPSARRVLGRFRGQAQAARLHGQHATDLLAAGSPASAAASMARVSIALLAQRLAAWAVEALGPHALIERAPGALLEGRLAAFHRASVASTISGGALEIQRRVIASVASGVPRDRGTDAHHRSVAGARFAPAAPVHTGAPRAGLRRLRKAARPLRPHDLPPAEHARRRALPRARSRHRRLPARPRRARAAPSAARRPRRGANWRNRRSRGSRRSPASRQTSRPSRRGRVLYLVSAPSDRLLRIETAPGLRLEAHCTALGKCLLAQLPDEAARSLLGEQPYRALTATLTTRDELERELAQIRRRGYALSEEELEDGLSSCAVGLPPGAGRPYAINVSSPSSRMSRRIARERLVAPLQRAAEEIGGLIGLLDFEGARGARR